MDPMIAISPASMEVSRIEPMSHGTLAFWRWGVLLIGLPMAVLLAGGRVDVMVGTLGGLVSAIDAGRAKPIAVLSKTRAPTLPNVPTTAEAGFPAAFTENWFAVFVPAGTPDAVVNKIHQGIKAVTHTPEGRQFLAKMDSEPTDASTAETAAHVKKELDYWTRLAKKLNISTQ
jgi:tripartite-type tricarboxylate transporter receptor subunit TctC